MKKSVIVFAFLSFLIILLMAVGVYFYFVGVKVDLSTNEVFEITQKLNTDEYIVFYQDVYDDIRTINLDIVMDSDIFYDMENFDYEIFYDENNIEDFESRYLTASINRDLFNDYVIKYTGYNVSEFNYVIDDKMDSNMNFLHKKLHYAFSDIDCLDGYRRKDNYYLNCYVSGDTKMHQLVLKSAGEEFIFLQNKYAE